jgi:hypothetical protein
MLMDAVRMWLEAHASFISVFLAHNTSPLDLFSISTWVISLITALPSPCPVSLSPFQEVALMPKGSYLINASRGEVVKVAEVAAALRSGHLVRVRARGRKK